MITSLQLENKRPSMNQAFGNSGQNDGSGSSTDGSRVNASIVSLLQAAGTRIDADTGSSLPLAVSHSGHTLPIATGATRSSNTDSEQLLQVVAASQGMPEHQRQQLLMENPVLLSSLHGGLAATRQVMIERVKQQELELDFLRSQFGLSRASTSQRLESMRGVGRNQPFMIPPSLRLSSLAATPISDNSALNILSCAAPVPSHFKSSSPAAALVEAASAPVDISKGTFPMKLHQMLSMLEQQPGGAEIASFLNHGNSFAIHKPREFVRHVMPKHFRMSRFSSFQRQLNLYDFVRITSGVDRGAYSHPQFVYGKPELTADMKRVKIKGVKNRKARLLEEEEEEEAKMKATESFADATTIAGASLKKGETGMVPDGQTDINV